VKSIRPRLSYANVISTLALFLVVAGGSAFAATQLAKNSVGAKQLKKNAVTSVKIKANAVTGAKIAAGAVDAGKLSDSAVNEAKLAAGSVTTGKIANGAVGPEKLAGSYLASSTPGVPIAGITVSSGGSIGTWFNRVGGKPTVAKGGTGIYNLVFPGLENQIFTESSIALASLLSGSGEIMRTSSGGNPHIETYNSAGALSDRAFNLVVFTVGSEP
jgi:hypothetical protein